MDTPATDLPTSEFTTIGGHAAVDFLNTVDWRLDPSRTKDRLANYQLLLTWLNTFGILTQSAVTTLLRTAHAEPETATTELRLVIKMRDDTYNALNGNREPQQLSAHLKSAHASSSLSRNHDGFWNWAPNNLNLETPRHLLALKLAELLTSEKILNFKRCNDQHCGWVYIDTSRQRNRRWCSPTDCGNRNRVRKHYHQTK